MVGIIKQTGTVNKNSGIFISKKMIAEIGFILIVAVAAVIVMETFQLPTASTGLQVKNAQQAEQATYTGAANPSQNAIANGQEANVASAYTPKFNPTGGATHGDATWQEMAFNNIPKSIPLAGGIVIRDLKVENDYFYGYVKNPASEKRSLDRITFAYLDKNGMATRYSTKIDIRAYNSVTKKYEWGHGAGEIPAGQEFYFRASTMKKYDTGNEIKFLQIES